MNAIIPYGRQQIDDEDVAAVAAVLKGDYLTTGPAVAEFEEALARRVGASHAVAVTSGTAALHLAMLALDLGPGDQVVVPSITFLASANAAALAGAEVVFSDVDPDTGLMRPEDFEDALRRAPKAKAAVVVHLNGITARMAELKVIADAHGVSVIEDACHALGSFHDSSAADNDDAKVGGCRYSAMATFSFHPVKTIATGEGGAITFGDASLVERVRKLRNHGMVRGEGNVTFADGFGDDGRLLPWIYEMQAPGFNYRMTDFQAALGSSQLEKLDRFLDVRRRMVGAYDEALKPLANRLSSVSRLSGENTARVGWHLYPVLCHGGARERLSLFETLVENGIRPQVHYFPVHRQPYYRQQAAFRALPGADAYYERVLSLPLYVDLTEAGQQRVIDTLTRFFA